MALLSRNIPIHQSLGGIAAAIQISGLPISWVTLREVNLPKTLHGWRRQLLRKVGLFLAHVGLVKDLLALPGTQRAFVREFLLIPTLVCWPLLWWSRKRWWFLVNHNFDSARNSFWQRFALRLLCRSGMQLMCLETDEAIQALGLRPAANAVVVLPHPVVNAPRKHTRSNGDLPIVGIIGSIRAEKRANQTIDDLTQMVREGGLKARLLIGTTNVELREACRKQGWEALDTTTAEQYQTALARCDVLVLNYARENYYFRASGIIGDAINAGVLVVAPDYPVIRSQVMQPVPLGVTFKDQTQLKAALEQALEMVRHPQTEAFLKHYDTRRPEAIAPLMKALCRP